MSKFGADVDQYVRHLDSLDPCTEEGQYVFRLLEPLIWRGVMQVLRPETDEVPEWLTAILDDTDTFERQEYD